MTVWTKDNLPNASWGTYRKTALTFMTPICGPATVATQEGEIELPNGWLGYLAVDTAGFPYPIERAEQQRMYEPVDPDAAFDTIPGPDVYERDQPPIIDVPLPEPQPCAKCDGCGKVANSDDQEPWTYWENLPLKSAMAVTLGLVQPIDCPLCGGSGKNILAAEIVGDES